MYTHAHMWILFHSDSVLLVKTLCSMWKQFGCQKWRNAIDIQCLEWIKTTHAVIHILQNTEEPQPGNETKQNYNNELQLGNGWKPSSCVLEHPFPLLPHEYNLIIQDFVFSVSKYNTFYSA